MINSAVDSLGNQGGLSATVPGSTRTLSAGQVVPTLKQKLAGWLDGLVNMLPNLVVAVLVLVLFWGLARLVRGALNRALRKVSDNSQIAGLLSAVAYIGVLVTGVFVALGVLQLEKTVTSLLAGVGIVGLALGFAFQDLAANFMAGIVMAVRRPFKPGDVIRAQEIMGHVLDVDLRATVIETFQGHQVQIPNKQVFGNPLINYSSKGKRRIDLEVGVSYGEDLEKVREVGVEALSEIEERLKDQEPTVHFHGFGASSIDFTARMWIEYPGQDYFEARSQMVQRLKQAFDENDITIPFPIRTLDFGAVGGRQLSEEMPLEGVFGEEANAKS